MTLLELSRNTKSQDKLRREIALLGDGELDFDAVQKLEYLDAVLREGYAIASYSSLDRARGNCLLVIQVFVFILQLRERTVSQSRMTCFL